MPSRQGLPIESGVALGAADVANPAVAVIDVEPVHEVGSPCAGGFHIREAPQR